MCWNAPVSITSFILGLLISIGIGIYALKHKRYSLAALSFGWIWVIGMQFIDFMLWQNKCNSSSVNKNYTKWGYILNVLQPVILFGIFINFSGKYGVSTKYKIIASVTIISYIIYLLSQANKVFASTECIETSKEHLQYPWWEKMKGGGYIYLVTLIIIFIMLVRPFKWSMKVLAYILGSLLFSSLVFRYGTASMWCWFAVITPFLALLFW